MDKRTFGEAMTYLAAAYGTEMSTERLAVYWDQLGALRDEVFRQAVKAAVAHEEKLPTVARLRALYQDIAHHAAMKTPKLPPPAKMDKARAVDLMAKIRERLRRTG